MSKKNIKIILKKSGIGRKSDQKKTLVGLGLTKVGRVKELEYKIARAEVIDISQIKNDKIVFGASVLLYDENSDKEYTYKIVGIDEADVEKSLISINSPVARALMGKEVGEVVSVKTPIGNTSYEILNIEYV